jgi:hypothetical protein
MCPLTMYVTSLCALVTFDTSGPSIAANLTVRARGTHAPLTMVGIAILPERFESNRIVITRHVPHGPSARASYTVVLTVKHKRY